MNALVLELSHEPILELELVGPDASITSIAQKSPTAVAAVAGPRGEPGSVGNISSDADNRAQSGTDGGLYVGPPEYETAQW